MNDATGSVTLCSAETVNAMAERFATDTRRARVADVAVTNLGDHVITFDTAHINERAGIPVWETKLARIGHTLLHVRSATHWLVGQRCHLNSVQDVLAGVGSGSDYGRPRHQCTGRRRVREAGQVAFSRRDSHYGSIAQSFFRFHNEVLTRKLPWRRERS